MKTKSFPYISWLAWAAAVAGVLPISGLAADGVGGGEVIPVQAAGDYVERGTMRIQVATKLGRPNAVTAEGAWIYRNRKVAGTEKRGALLVRFEDGRVSELALITSGAKHDEKVVAVRQAMKKDSSRSRMP